MSVKVLITLPLTRLTRGQAEVQASGSNIAKLIADLERRFPGFKKSICDESGRTRRFINIYLNEEDVRFLKQGNTALKDGDEVSIILAVPGG